jgi:hypothetical protein
MIVMAEACTIMFSRSLIDGSRSIIVNSRSTIDDHRVMLQLVVQFTIVIYDIQIFIVQATCLFSLV